MDLACDYLVDAAAQDDAATLVPDWTWTAVIDHADAADAVEVAWQVSFAGRAELVPRVFDRLLGAGEYVAAAEVAACLGEAGRERQAVELLETTIDRAERAGTVAAQDVLDMRHSLVWQLGEKVAGRGDPGWAAAETAAVAAMGPDHPLVAEIRADRARLGPG